MNDATVGTVTNAGDVNSLLGMELSELADLAEIKVPPVGRYQFSLETSTKDTGTHPQVLFAYTILGIVEQVNATDVPAKLGDKFYVSYNIDNEFGLGGLKKDLKLYAAHFNTSNIGELLTHMDGVMIAGTVKQRVDKTKLDDDGNPRVYGSVVNVEIQ